MKVLIYDNKERDVNGQWLNILIKSLADHNIEYQLLENDDLKGSYVADVIISLGGDGTILFLTEFSIRNNIPIIGINIGKLGFLTEFEKNEINIAVEALINNDFKHDKRSLIEIEYNGKKYFALNDVFTHFIYSQSIGKTINDIKIMINGEFTHRIKGDGVVVSTPTGSTAYSLSVGGPILSPDVNAFLITPIAPHTLNLRPIVYNADAHSEVCVMGGAKAGLFVDGKFIGEIKESDNIIIKKSNFSIIFLRRKSFAFYKRLSDKLKDSDGE